MIVLVARRNSTGNAYHLSEDCQYVGDSHREWDRETAEEWDYEPCEKCARGVVEA